MVIEVFPFSNELDILEIRLNILEQFVDNPLQRANEKALRVLYAAARASEIQGR